MSKTMEGRAGLVTGAAGGLGRGSALALAAAGAAVVVSDLESSRAGGEETVGLIEAAGGRASFFGCDVTSSEQQEALVAHTLATYGALDFAHNNAGVSFATPTHELSEADFDRVTAINLKGVFLGLKHQIGAMLAAGRGGAIVNTASLSGLIALPGLSAYTASKHGVIGLTKVAAVEYAEQGIRVNAICPGAVRTPITEPLPDEVKQMLTSVQAIRRFSEPSEQGAVVAFLCSEAASFVTGVAMPVDGGAFAM